MSQPLPRRVFLATWRWLAVVRRVPGAAWVMERGYRLFLRWRPLLQRWASRLDQPALKRPKSRGAGA